MTNSVKNPAPQTPSTPNQSVLDKQLQSRPVPQSEAKGASPPPRNPPPASQSSTKRTKVCNIKGHPHSPAQVDWDTVPQDFEFKLVQQPLSTPKPNPTTKTSKKRKHDDTDATEVLEEPDHFNSGVTSKYTISPATYWEKARKYKKFTIEREEFETQCYVYVKQEEDTSAPSTTNGGADPPDRLTDWVARVLEIRGGDTAHVYLRVYWMYRPEDLPAGRQPYHGRREVIASNDMQIIDAKSVQGRANVVRWDESNDDDDAWMADDEPLYWRQYYDKLSGQLSNPRTHCTCATPHKPEHPLLRCSTCATWLHATCLLRFSLRRIYTSRSLALPARIASPSPHFNKRSKKRHSAPALYDYLAVGKLGKDESGVAFTARLDMKGDERVDSGVATDVDKDGSEQVDKDVDKDSSGARKEKTKIKIVEVFDGVEKSAWDEEVQCLKCESLIE
ncbi:hypothetical protein M501DRAFT_1018982 [Patellaria atrata CBS 101060]|uniref:BAH domain-containing protein n=1 Tax=Patellaria atrata CBS 101060 TaxID=1346257 RepID=A0A9P4VQ50_9PEZI|nr:hypothetical protein M501DRAFT_1018982 [Patellaria atrata CBS 101060]